MNYLAHAYLSFGHPEILVGNLISDFVKGKKKFAYPPLIQQGISLHRAIDTFTDTHEASKEAKSFFRSQYRLYSAAFADVIYDHFLAIDAAEFQEASLFSFSENVYLVMDNYYPVFPDKFQVIYPYMKKHNWLNNYQHPWAIRKSFEGLVYRAAYLTESDHAFRIFNENYSALQLCYHNFFPDVKEFAFNQFQNILLNT